MKILSALALTIAVAIGHAQSFEGVIRYDVSSKSPGAFSIGIEHVATLKLKGGSIYTVLKSKREGQLETVYLAGENKSYQIDHIRQRYVIMPKQPAAAEVKVNATSDTKKILGHRCTKYVSEKTDGASFTFWVTKDLADIDCKSINENLSFIPCTQLGGIPLMIDTVAPNGSYTLTVIEIKPQQLPGWLFELNKDYTIEEAPLRRVDH